MHDLRELLTDPARVAEMSLEETRVAFLALVTLQIALAARLGASPARSSEERGSGGEDRLLTAVEVAKHFGCSVAWVYRQAKHWPFTRRASPKVLRFSEAGLRDFLADRRRRG
jgi:predicted DNA-binding transcriptional regulator AlpA